MTRDELEYQELLSKFFDSPVSIPVKNDRQMMKDLQSSKTFEEIPKRTQLRLQAYLKEKH